MKHIIFLIKDGLYKLKGSFLLLSLFIIAISANAQVTDSVATPAIDTLKAAEAPVVVNKSHDTLPLAKKGGPTPHLYRMNYWTNASFAIVATAANIYAIPNLILAKQDITPAELAAINPSAVPAFDRISLRQDPYKINNYDKVSDYTLQGIIAATAIMGFDKNILHDALRLFVMYAEMHALTYSIYNFSPFGPSFQNKLRPVTYYTDLPEELRNGGNNRNSLYSGHTASAAASTFFMAKVFTDYHPEFSTGKRYFIFGLAALPPLAVGYLRMKALKHFPSDILVGYIVGAVCGVAVPEMHRYKKQAIRWGLTTTPVGPGLCATWSPR